jgi:hypothetical protein
MAYSTDNDLVKVQKDILNLGVADWAVQHIEAEEIINRAVRSQWFSGVATEYSHTTAFDADKLLLPEQLTRASVYKVLELAYLFVMQDSAEHNPFEKKHKMFQAMYETEMGNVFSSGLTYDWDGSGSEDQSESNVNLSPRMIVR